MSFQTIRVYYEDLDLKLLQIDKVKVGFKVIFEELKHETYPGGSSTETIIHGEVKYIVEVENFSSLTGNDIKSAALEKLKILLPNQGDLVVH